MRKSSYGSRSFIFRTYRGKLFIVSAIAITISLIIIIHFSYNTLTRQSMGTYSLSMRENMNMLKERIEAYYNQQDISIETIFQQTSIQNFLMGRSSQFFAIRKHLDGQMQNLYNANPQMLSLQIYTTIDRTRARIRTQYPNYTFNYMTLEYFLAMLPFETNDFENWSDYTLIPISEKNDAEGNDHSCWMCKTVRSPRTNEVLAVAVMEMSFDAIRQFTKNVNYYPGEVLSVINHNRQVLFYDNLESVPNAGIMEEIDTTLFCERQTIGNENYYVFIAPIERYGGYLVRLIPAYWITQKFDELRMNLVLIGAICLIIALLVMSYLSTRFSKPIRHLIESMRLMGYGEMGKSIEISTNDLEVRALVDQFNNMTMLINRLFTESYRLKLSQRTAQLKELQSQLNPHFMFNTLQTINYFALEYGANEILAISQALGDMLRYCLKSDIAPVSLKEEVENVNRYLIIQKFRLVEGLDSCIDIEPELLDLQMPRMLLQPLVENAVIHGTRGDGTTLHVSISGSKEGSSVLLNVYDDGKGIEQERLMEMKAMLANPPESYDGHIGLLNCCNRLHYNYDNGASIDIDSIRNEYTQVSIIIPLIGGKP